MTINKVVQNHQVNKLGANQIEHRTKTDDCIANFSKTFPQMKFWRKLGIFPDSCISSSYLDKSYLCHFYELNNSFIFFNLLLDVAFEIFHKPKNLWDLKEALHVNTVRIHNARLQVQTRKRLSKYATSLKGLLSKHFKK